MPNYYWSQGGLNSKSPVCRDKFKFTSVIAYLLVTLSSLTLINKILPICFWNSNHWSYLKLTKTIVIITDS